MAIGVAVFLWFVCGLWGTWLAFHVARKYNEDFDPIHVWLATLGVIGLVLAWLMVLGGGSDRSQEGFLDC